MSNVWRNYKSFSNAWLRSALKLKLRDTYAQNWQSDVNKSTQCINYRIFKNLVGLECYLIKLPSPHRIALTKFRCANHRLPIVMGRYKGIERQNRTCNLCNLNKLGDEFHYLFECQKLEKLRQKYIKPYFRIRPNTLKMNQLFNEGSMTQLTNLAKFTVEILKLH